MHRRELLRLLSLSALAAGCDAQPTSPRSAAFSPQTTPGDGFVPDVEMVLTAAPNEVSVLPGEYVVHPPSKHSSSIPILVFSNPTTHRPNGTTPSNRIGPDILRNYFCVGP